ncbi:MAG: tRNA uridine-5-carboxymethylaminomethyl(34) synthesis GTPase MnmE [Pseudomonadota bacterium]
MGASDTIAALATPVGSGGIGIVRISGAEALPIVARLIGKDEQGFADRVMLHGYAVDPEHGERLDEVLVVVMRGPRSYTGEDVAEVHGHGGLVCMASLLRAVLALGARPAEPGEFTRRAFFNGRLDLTQAEAVGRVIAATSERALRVAQAQLGGVLGRAIRGLRGRVIDLLAEVEAEIDFPDEDIDSLVVERMARDAEAVAREAIELAGTYRLGRGLCEGIEVALVGPPNAGKSSLLNALVGAERAVVSPEPGTTRDYVEARTCWEGVPVTLIDTAGEREATSMAERRGIELCRQRVERVDAIVRLRDPSRAGLPVETEEMIVAQVRPELFVWSKVDLIAGPAGELGVSALSGQGLDELRKAILARTVGDVAGRLVGSEEAMVTSERQRGLLAAAGEAARRASAAAIGGLAVELVAADLRIAAARLGEITGDEVTPDVLAQVFQRFCIGK